ncbi:MAG: hypothetical protein II980_01750 [Clostridia bacterium]|nr:hypothetical protein [Clostridia bacterium]
MLENKHNKYASFNSDFLSATLNKENGSIAFFGIESSGRDRDKHASFNLMLPSYGARAGAFKAKSQISAEFTEDCALFKNEKGSTVAYTMPNTHTIKVDLTGVNKNDIFSTKWSIKTAPPTIWTKNDPRHLKTNDPLQFIKQDTSSH